MRIKYPISKATAEQLIDNNREGNGGYYPLGLNNLWHGGIHLYSPARPIRCIADGKVIAYRITKEDVFNSPYNRNKTYSNCFVLVEHTFVSPKEQEINFYSLYMSLFIYSRKTVRMFKMAKLSTRNIL